MTYIEPVRIANCLIFNNDSFLPLSLIAMLREYFTFFVVNCTTQNFFGKQTDQDNKRDKYLDSHFEVNVTSQLNDSLR